MKTLQFEGLKVALKQNKDGYVLTLNVHPDDIPEELLRDFVGARYQVVMVRLGDNEEPLDRQEAFGGDVAIQAAAMLCRDPEFWDYLHDDLQIIDRNEKEASNWLRDAIGVISRSELKTNPEARENLAKVRREYQEWKAKR
jgi:hypothetical protein